LAPEIQAIIFDMDGVIIDSNPVHREAWAAYNRRFGIETTEAMHQRMYGKRNDQIVRDFFGAHLTDAEVAAHGAAKEALYREMMRPTLTTALVPGLRDFLEAHRHMPLGLGTNAEPANVKFVLEEADLAHYFSAIVDGSQVERPKPAPDIYLKVAELLHIAPPHCLVFEDSYSGIEAAQAAGMIVIGIKTTHQTFPNLPQAIDNFVLLKI
jgi:beta-phosphoglucomutase